MQFEKGILLNHHLHLEILDNKKKKIKLLLLS